MELVKAFNPKPVKAKTYHVSAQGRSAMETCHGRRLAPRRVKKIDRRVQTPHKSGDAISHRIERHVL